jgi:hypothetical protein
VPHEPFVEEILGGLGLDAHPGAEGRIERRGLQHVGAVQVRRIEGGIDGGAEPDEPDPRPLAQRQAEFQLRRGLVDLIHHDRVVPGDQVILEPAPGDAGGDDDDVPGGRLGGGLPLPVDDAHPQRLPENRLRHRPDAEGLAGPGAGDDAESLAARRPFPQFGAVFPLQDGVDVGQPEGQLDGLAGGPGGGDDDDAPLGGALPPEGVGIGGEEVVPCGMHGLKIGGAA